jgi:hypothetical protein
MRSAIQSGESPANVLVREGLFGSKPFPSGPRHCGQSAAVADPTHNPAAATMQEDLKRARMGFPMFENG